MFTVIGFMLTGITVGYLFRNIAFLQKTEKTISITIFLLLFLLGISVGSNELIINNLAAFGWQAAILAFSATCGSILASWMVLKFSSRKEVNNERKYYRFIVFCSWLHIGSYGMASF